MTAITAPLEHVGVPYDDPESLVASVGPRIAAALDAGDEVYLAVDRRTARAFADRLGAAGRRVHYPSPTAWPRDIVRDLRAIVPPGRRALMLGQYVAAGVDDDERLHREDGVNLVLGDQPLTVLCTCPRDAETSMLAALRTAHPNLLVDDAVVPNLDFRSPGTHEPVTDAVWGPPTLRVDFRAPVDLHRVREHVARVAEEVGLRGEPAREAVLAAHEAAVLVAGDAVSTGRDALCVLEVRAGAGVLHCELGGPRSEAVSLTGPDGPHGSDGDPLRIVRMFCHRALLHDEADVRTVRLLRTPGGPPLD